MRGLVVRFTLFCSGTAALAALAAVPYLTL
jgi:hypothetical protein